MLESAPPADGNPGNCFSIPPSLSNLSLRERGGQDDDVHIPPVFPVTVQVGAGCSMTLDFQTIFGFPGGRARLDDLLKHPSYHSGYHLVFTVLVLVSILRSHDTTTITRILEVEAQIEPPPTTIRVIIAS